MLIYVGARTRMQSCRPRLLPGYPMGGVPSFRSMVFSEIV